MRSREEPRESVSSSQCCGSGRIGIILLDPDPHPEVADPDFFPFQRNVKLNHTSFYEGSIYCQKF